MHKDTHALLRALATHMFTQKKKVTVDTISIYWLAVAAEIYLKTLVQQEGTL